MDFSPVPVSTDERQLLQHLANFWRTEGAWPRRERLFLEYRERGLDLEAVLESLPDVFWSRNLLAGDERIELTVAGLEQCDGDPCDRHKPRRRDETIHI